MSSIHKSKQYVLIDMFKDTSRYLDNIFTIDNPEFEKHIPYIYQMELQLNKANTSNKKNFFPWFIYKSYWQWCSYQRLRQTQWLRISYRQFPLVEWRCSYYVVYISQLVRFAMCCTSVLDFHSKNLQLKSKPTDTGLHTCITSFEKTFGKFFGSYSELLSKFSEISFQEYVSEWISNLGFYVDLVYKIRRVKCEANFVSSGLKIHFCS